ncbi:MAG: hypothetical protein LBE36_08845 [Flavobacteriaceae bacterium]|nr:hypothetical protein [Flavobacteriaceae bacterium]
MAVKYEKTINFFGATDIPRGTFYFDAYYFDENGLQNKKSIKISKFVQGDYDFLENPQGFLPYTIENENKSENQKYDYYETINNQFTIVGNIGMREFLDTEHRSWRFYDLKGITNSKGEFTVPQIYNDIKQKEDCNIFVVKKDNKYGVINIENEFIVNLEYDDIDIIGSVIVVAKDSKRAVLDFTGKTLISFKNTNYREGNAGALMTNNYKIIDKKN